MGCGGTKHLCDNIDGMLDRLRIKIDQKEVYIKRKDEKGIASINQQIELLRKDIKVELTAINNVINNPREVSAFEILNGRFQFILNKDVYLNSITM